MKFGAAPGGFSPRSSGGGMKRVTEVSSQLKKWMKALIP
jgi:hypothetical protein